MITFSKQKLTLLHRMALQTPGGDYSISDNSAMDAMLEEIFNTDKYPTKEEKAAKLGFSIVYERPFAIENTSAGMYIMLAFLEVNGIRMNPEPEEVVELGKAIANGKANYDFVYSWILQREFR